MPAACPTLKDIEASKPINILGQQKHARYCEIGAREIARWMRMSEDDYLLAPIPLTVKADVAARNAGMHREPIMSSHKYHAMCLFNLGGQYQPLFPPGCKLWIDEDGKPWIINPYYRGKANTKVEAEAKELPYYTDGGDP